MIRDLCRRSPTWCAATLLALALMPTLAKYGSEPDRAVAGPDTARTSPRADRDTVRLVAVGDILLDRGVGRKIARHGPDYPFALIADRLRSADIAFGNLECPISASHVPVAKPFSFRATPAAASGLGRAGFDIVSLANNHTLDCTRAGLADTMAFLRSASPEGIAWCGAGMSGARAEDAAIVVRRGLRVAFVGFCDIVQDASYLRPDLPSVAQASKAGVLSTIRRARGRADVVVASFHWGIEYEPRPTRRQMALAADASRAGADLVIGHHPHVLQGLQRIPRQGRSPTLVAYSLGNFVFDPQRAPADRTAVLDATLDRSGVRDARLIPCRIVACRPLPVAGAKAGETLDRVEALSNELRMPRR